MEHKASNEWFVGAMLTAAISATIIAIAVNHDRTVDSSSPPKMEPKEVPKWSSPSASTDEMTSVVSHYTSSPTTAATNQVEFPYHDMVSWIGVGCNKTDEWIYLGFSQSPNLIDEAIRVRWSNVTESYGVSQEIGHRFVHINDDQRMIHQLTIEPTIKVQLSLYGEDVIFQYEMNNVSAAIAALRASCRS